MLQIMPNPDNVPGAVTTGYQRQNTNIYGIQTGIDTTEPYDNGTSIIVPAGGIVEVNGVLYKIVSQVSLTKTAPTRAYWVEIVTSTDNQTATLQLVNRPGAWNSTKGGCYNGSNRRTLNWVSLGTLNNAPTTGNVFSRTTKGPQNVMLQRGWYYVTLCSGSGGGDGTNANGRTAGSGGIVTAGLTANRIFFADKAFYNIYVGGNGANGSNGSIGAGVNNTYSGGGGGGGGGSGEESKFEDLTTGIKPSGNGGNGGQAQTSGNPPFGGYKGGRNSSNGQGDDCGLGGNYIGGAGGSAGYTNGNMDGGKGGDGGNGGQSTVTGSAGGYCVIYKIEN